MRLTANLQKLWPRALGVGVLNAVLLSAVMVPVNLAGVSPMPEPPSLAFAQTLLGTALPLPVGLLFHVAYVTLWSVLFIAAAYPDLAFTRALALGLVLWLAALVIFFPVIGWGVLGLDVSPTLIVASLVPHLLFGVFLWGLGRLMIPDAGSVTGQSA